MLVMRPVRSFEALIDPLRPEAFFAEHWENRPLHHSRADDHFYDSVLSNADIEHIISTEDLRYPAIQLARHGGYFPPEVYTRHVNHGSEVFQGVPDIDKIRAEYRSGATIVLPALHRTWAPLKDLCESLESYFTHAVHANAYLTPGSTTGFTPHYDTHDVLVLQIAGKKLWRIHEPPVVLPHRSQPFARQGYAAPPPVLECELLPGDLLYLPRGYVHGALTSEGHSAHVTIGITVYTWTELFSELVSSSKNDIELRKALPVGFARGEGAKDVLRDGMVRRLDALRKDADFEGVVETFTQRVRSSRARPSGSFKADVRVIGPGTVLETPEKYRYSLGTERGNTVLVLDGRKLLLPAGVRPTLEAICARASFRIGDLPKHLEDHATLAFVQFLEGEGFLRQTESRDVPPA
jgi:Cupin superfamily protein